MLTNQLMFLRLLYKYTLEAFLLFTDYQNLQYIECNKICSVEDFNRSLFDLYMKGYLKIGYNKTIQVTRETGKKIYKRAKDFSGILKFDELKTTIEAVISFFSHMNYIQDGKIILHEEQNYEYGNLDKNQFFYIMYSPVIFSSAKDLFNEIKIAPHFSSRTIQAALQDICIDADFDKNFDINLFEQDLVVEKWNYKKIKR